MTKTKYNWYFSQLLKRDKNVEWLMEKRSNQNDTFFKLFNIMNKIKYMIHITVVKSVSGLFI